MGWWTWLLYLLSNWYFWPFIGGVLYAVAWPFIKRVRLWQAKRRFISNGHDRDVAGPVLSWFRIDSEDHLFVRGANQCFIEIR